MLPIHGMPGHLIRRVQQVSGALFAEECAGFGVTPVQYAALSALRHYPDLDATRLAVLVAFDRSTIGDVLERLETKGWIERKPSRTDRRIKRLALTDQGEALLDRTGDAVARVQTRLLDPLPPADRDTFIRLLTQIAAAHDTTTAASLRMSETA